MSAQPSPEDQEWLDRNRPRRGRPARSPNLKQVRDRDATTGEDVANIVEDERNLREIIDSMIDDVHHLKIAVGSHARATVAWKVHHGHATKQLEGFGASRTNEATRDAYAIAYHDVETGAEGDVLYREFVETEGELDALQIGLKAKSTIASGLQTLINQGARLSGLT